MSSEIYIRVRGVLCSVVGRAFLHSSGNAHDDIPPLYNIVVLFSFEFPCSSGGLSLFK